MKIKEFIDNRGINAIQIDGLENFLIEQIFDCGQCFRFDIVDDSRHKLAIDGVAHGKYLRLAQDSPDSVTIYNTNALEFDSLWKHYLALDVDYKGIRRDIAERFRIAACGNDSVITKAMDYGHGIRVLRQEPWETVCSFIISQNNNIPRIKKIIAQMCREFGEPISFGDNIYYSFPSAKVLADAGVDKIFALHTGFRAKYIYDAAFRVSSGELNFDAIFASEPEKAMEMLCSVKGIGPKVASCSMLFGFDKTEAFPIDVWVKRVLEKYYPKGLNISMLGKYAGIAQQYLFYYERWLGE